MSADAFAAVVFGCGETIDPMSPKTPHAKHDAQITPIAMSAGEVFLGGGTCGGGWP